MKRRDCMLEGRWSQRKSGRNLVYEDLGREARADSSTARPAAYQHEPANIPQVGRGASVSCAVGLGRNRDFGFSDGEFRAEGGYELERAEAGLVVVDVGGDDQFVGVG
jgi:hypothetical protein